MPLKGHCMGFLGFLMSYLLCDGVMRQGFVFGRPMVGKSTSLLSIYKSFKSYDNQKCLISSIFCSFLFSWNPNFRHNLIDVEIKDLKRLMPSLFHVFLQLFDHYEIVPLSLIQFCQLLFLPFQQNSFYNLKPHQRSRLLCGQWSIPMTC